MHFSEWLLLVGSYVLFYSWSRGPSRFVWSDLLFGVVALSRFVCVFYSWVRGLSRFVWLNAHFGVVAPRGFVLIFDLGSGAGFTRDPETTGTSIPTRGETESIYLTVGGPGAFRGTIWEMSVLLRSMAVAQSVRVPVASQAWAFVVLELKSCVFPIGVGLALAFSRVVHVAHLPRYDLVFCLCVAMQAVMVAGKLETLKELAVVSLFHLLGLALEVNKTHAGSWSYPEAGFLKLWGVPLYSGFMYASVASYICQAYRRLDLAVGPLPPFWVSVLVSALAYVNFFLRGVLPDVRWMIIALVFFVFRATTASFSLAGVRQSMPLGVAFMGIGGALWVAENVATLLGAWQYPYQQHGWQMVDFSKATSWFLLTLVCFVPVAAMHAHSARRLGGNADGHT